MRRIFTSILIAAFSILVVTTSVHGQTTIQGRLIDAETNEPLSEVNVFLSGTKIGTATNENGQYQLQGVPAGGYRLVMSSIGYKKIKLNIVVGPNETRKLNFPMKPVVYEMPEIYVGDLDKKWEKHLKRFTELFIGMSESADSVEILNPEVLRFRTNWWGRLSAEALAPLKIDNHSLGYHITYYLDEFIYTGTRTLWDGEPLFKEMTPADSSQAAYWKKNRREAFHGSLRHFLLSLINDRVKEEGFMIQTIVKNVHGITPTQRFPVKPRSLLKDNPKKYLYHLSFFDRLEIIYRGESESKHYLRWQKSNRKPANMQTSYLELNERPITVDTDGEVLEPYGATQFGYFAFQRLAKETPREYRPEDYSSKMSFNN